MHLDVRKAFYCVACLITLGLSGWGAYTVLSVGMRAYIFTEADRTYHVTTYDNPAFGTKGVNKEEADEVDRKNARAQKEYQFSWALPVFLISFPIFLWFYPEVRKKEEPTPSFKV